MPILPVAPIELPAKTLDKLWAARISITAPTPNGEANAIVNLIPYNDQGDVGASVLLPIKEIISKATENPESNIAKAMHYLLAAIDDEYKAAHNGR